MRSFYQEILDQLHIAEQQRDISTKFLCRLCLSMIDDANHFYLNRCCQKFTICVKCMEKFKWSQIDEEDSICPNVECLKEYRCIACINVGEERCRHFDDFFIPDNILLQEYDKMVMEQKVFPELYKRNKIRIGLVPSESIAQRFKTLTLPDYEFSIDSCISRVEMSKDSNSKLKEQILIIELAKPFYFTRVLFQLLHNGFYRKPEVWMVFERPQNIALRAS